MVVIADLSQDKSPASGKDLGSWSARIDHYSEPGVHIQHSGELCGRQERQHSIRLGTVEYHILYDLLPSTTLLVASQYSRGYISLVSLTIAIRSRCKRCQVEVGVNS